MAIGTHPHLTLLPAPAFLINPSFFIHSHLVLSHPGAEACLNLKLVVVVTSMCCGGGLFWVQLSGLPLPRCVPYTWDNSASLPGWLWEPNETRYLDCLCVCSMPICSHAVSSVSFLHFFSFVIVTYILLNWDRAHLLSLLGLTPVSTSVIRALKWLLQNPAIRPVVGHVDGSRAASSRSCTVSFNREGAV